jgi:putative FmdB family regulatory protein
MPIYAYRCKKCGSEEEHIQRMSDPPMVKCEACGGRLVRLVSPAAFHLKGGGWYRDGYASSKPGGSEGGGEGKSSEGGSDAASSSEKKDKPEKKDKKGGGSSKDAKPAAKRAS